MDVVIVDYGAGNLRSVQKAVEKTGWQPHVTTRPQDVLAARALILPGVGAAADTMRNLTEAGMVEPVKQYIASGRPFLGVCMGLQALMSVSEEGGEHRCLDVIPGRVRLLNGGGERKVPQMGWNTLKQLRPHPIFRGIPDDTYFYFLHSYYVDPSDGDTIIGEAEYGGRVPAVLARENLVATQFHPEKSGRYGLQLYANFIEKAMGEALGAGPK